MPITYHSTRGEAPELNFDDVVLAGLAPDGGLYVPKTLPSFSKQEIASWKNLSYPELAMKVLEPFFEGSSVADYKALIRESYREFRRPEVAPLIHLHDNHYLLELFHGPTLAFKDFALQFLGRLLGELLAKKDRHVTVLGATSGDTGSAAIAGCRGRQNMDIVILHPKGRVSDVQRRQMTTVEDANVHNIAIKGSFDDCQNIVKTLFTDHDFREKQQLTAVNSINWARIMAQIVYYFSAALKLGSPTQKVSFSVPTGNFGDIYAGHLARRMGLPVETLLIASNRNDILTRCYKTGEYKTDTVNASLSPSMDIQISSNFERLLFELYDENSDIIRQLMVDLKQNGGFNLSIKAHTKLQKAFKAERVDDKETLVKIADIYEITEEILDPHTAIGVAAAQRLEGGEGAPIITLATAHPAKFPAAVEKAINQTPDLPEHMNDLFEKQERFTCLGAQAEEVKAYIEAL